MKKDYFEPEFDILKFTLSEDLLRPSNEGDIGSGGSSAPGEGSGEEESRV